MTNNPDDQSSQGGEGNMYSENPWLYADEASLYSIEEDSREERTVDEFSPAPKSNNEKYGGDIIPSDSSNGVGADRFVGVNDEANGDLGVEIRFEEEEDNLTKASDDRFLFYDNGQKRFRLMMAICLFCTFLVVIALSVVLTQFNQSQSRGSVSAITNESPGDVASSFSDRPTVSPTTLAPSQDTTFIFSENYVYEAVRKCQGNATFFDTQTIQGVVFQSLVNEVHESTVFYATGAIEFDELHTVEYLQEKFALSMLYYSTNGESWTWNENWLSSSDPCLDWAGVVCANDRTESSCAVTELKLASNGLSGALPVELCCLPCVEAISMPYNNIGGDILTCLIEIPSLVSIDFAGNVFGQPSDAAASQRSSALNSP